MEFIAYLSAEFIFVHKLFNSKSLGNHPDHNFPRSHCCTNILCQCRIQTECRKHCWPKIDIIARGWVL